MPVGFVRVFKSLLLSRAGYRAGLTSLLLLAGASSVHDATASRETRTLSFHHTHSGEDLTVTYKRNGRYDEAALKQLNHFLRDWRNQAQTTMDPYLFDILWEVYRDVDGNRPIQIISSYRSPATNAMLHRRSSGVARHSQHMLGRAMDFFIPGVALEKIRFAGLRLQRGGVGFYPTSGSPFVHLDTGSIRHWPRMTHDQLARVFPDGRTVHVPSDGKPLAGYQLALADIQKRGKDGDGFAFEKPKSLLASLFKSKQADEDDVAPATAVPAVQPVAARPAAAAVVTAAAIPAEPVPLPRAKPVITASYQVASADDVIRPPAPIRQETAAAPEPEPRFRTPADIINSRGFWGDTPPTKPKQATPAQVAAITARQALANAVDPQTTASIDHAFHALAYAPAPATLDRAHVVAASAPIPRHLRPRPAAKVNPMTVNEVTSVVAKGRQGPDSRVAVSTRLAAAKGDTVWMRAMILSPSATTAMSSTVFGEPDMTLMRAHFVKPQVTVAARFSDDPLSGLVSDRFTGSAVASLPTVTFQTAALR